MNLPPPPIEIAEVRADDIPQVVDFVMLARAQIFPQLDPQVLPDDLARFARVYLESGDAKFIVARKAEQIVGVVGYLPYDYRFPQLTLGTGKTVEIVRLFVLPDCRGAGLAAALCAALEQSARQNGVQILYLHTHPFLPGAIEFWRKRHFEIVEIEEDLVWRTTHMRRATDMCP